jgi:predicted DNA-binding transcriptional regulator AlpA
MEYVAEDIQLTAPQVAQRLGVAADTWWSWVTRHRAPQPDGREPLSNKPWWWASTVDAWDADRPRGARMDLRRAG